MPRLTQESVVVVGSKEMKVEELLKTIIYLPSQQVKTFFVEIGLKIPREIRIFVLREVLREKVIDTRKSRLTLADELNYRLSWYTEFSESQLENLLVFFDDRQLEKEYLEEFWTDIIAYMMEKEVQPKIIKKLLDLSIAHVKTIGLELPNMRIYNKEIKDLFFDSFGRLDGLTPAKFRPVLYKSSTLKEIREIGKKYDVSVPKRLKKKELAKIIVSELEERGKSNAQIVADIQRMSVINMQRFAIDNDIKASTELKKEEIIEYILANAQGTKESYFVPESKDDYDMEVEEVKESADPQTATAVLEGNKIEETDEEIVIEVEEVEEATENIEETKEVEELAKEEPVQDTKEETVEETKEVEKQEVKEQSTQQRPIIQQPVDLSALVVEITKLREAFEGVATKINATDEDFMNENQETEPEAKEMVILNSNEFYGTKKAFKKTVKKKKIKKEKDDDKSTQEDTKTDDDKELAPKELRVVGKLGLGLLKIVLKIALVVVVFGGILIIGFSVFTYFVTITELAGITNTINGILGFRIVDRIHALIAGLGI